MPGWFISVGDIGWAARFLRGALALLFTSKFLGTNRSATSSDETCSASSDMGRLACVQLWCVCDSLNSGLYFRF